MKCVGEMGVTGVKGAVLSATLLLAMSGLSDVVFKEDFSNCNRSLTE